MKSKAINSCQWLRLCSRFIWNKYEIGTAFLLASLLLIGCTSQYGYSINKPILKISSESERIYYIITPESLIDKDRKILDNNIKLDLQSIKEIISTRPKNKSNNLGVMLDAGAYYIIIECSKNYKAIRLELSGTSQKLDINCNDG